jgi:dCMP deaminase
MADQSPLDKLKAIRKWPERMFRLASEVASWSKDPGYKVGCVITDPQHRILGIGYNGFPRECEDDESVLNDRPRKIFRTVHAEANALLNSHGNLNWSKVYTTHFTCASCAGLLIQAGVAEIHAYDYDLENERWLASWLEAERMFQEAGVRVYFYGPRPS